MGNLGTSWYVPASVGLVWDSPLIRGISRDRQESAKRNAELEQDLGLGKAEVVLAAANRA